jgi:hypothetical protein
MRDKELIRKIMEHVAKGEDTTEFSLDGYSQEQLRHNCYLIMEKGWADGAPVILRESDIPQAVLFSLTWEGYDELGQDRRCKTCKYWETRSATPNCEYIGSDPHISIHVENAPYVTSLFTGPHFGCVNWKGEDE